MRRRLTVLVAAAAFMVVGCGGDDADTTDETAANTTATEPATETGTSGTEAATPEATEASPPVGIEGDVNTRGTSDVSGEDAPMLEIVQGDFFFDPTFVQAQPGTTVTVTVPNEGDTAHTFTIDSLGIDETLQPGGTVEVEVELPEEGPLVFVCRFHETQGMQGAFFFEEGTEAAQGPATVNTEGDESGVVGS